jgi:hypothetical protein
MPNGLAAPGKSLPPLCVPMLLQDINMLGQVFCRRQCQQSEASQHPEERHDENEIRGSRT